MNREQMNAQTPTELCPFCGKDRVLRSHLPLCPENPGDRGAGSDAGRSGARSEDEETAPAEDAMKHAVLMVAYNQIELTKDAVNSILAQDIGELDLLLIDNGSTDGTRQYFESLRGLDLPNKTIIRVGGADTNLSPNKVANRALAMVFSKHDKVLCVANDVILPPNFYRLLNQWPRGMVTASQNPSKDFPLFSDAHAVSECTPFAVLLLRKWLYDAVMAKDGYFFDEGMFCYASDCDLALRMAACGLRGVQLDVQYYHFQSATIKLAPEAEREQMAQQADRDRAYFKAKHGFAVDSLEYGQVAQDPNWKAERR